MDAKLLLVNESSWRTTSLATASAMVSRNTAENSWKQFFMDWRTFFSAVGKYRIIPTHEKIWLGLEADAGLIRDELRADQRCSIGEGAGMFSSSMRFKSFSIKSSSSVPEQGNETS
ncbi:hypothetical protein PsorP6_011310 [Peronosclerospora sorghi]|uniref:Uncharacterized protein n=1 Tax=Peronosclerospora sorghi TaxID=230839 RepID=A0ACC0WKW0_9STRA|nr:hypothetical protein PsorP6_011310 [Peronosclerospora sorghi]